MDVSFPFRIIPWLDTGKEKRKQLIICLNLLSQKIDKFFVQLANNYFSCSYSIQEITETLQV